MAKTVLQVPMDITLRKNAEKAALSAGFSSLQEVVRVFLSKLTTDSVEVGFYDKSIRLSDKAENRYIGMLKDINSGENIVKTH